MIRKRKIWEALQRNSVHSSTNNWSQNRHHVLSPIKKSSQRTSMVKDKCATATHDEGVTTGYVTRLAGRTSPSPSLRTSKSKTLAC